jgi:hypothetical protein
MESTVPSVNCWENQSLEIECEDDCCQGGEGCLNKRIQKCKVNRQGRKEEKKALVFLQMRISKRVSTLLSTPEKLFTKIPTTSIL